MDESVRNVESNATQRPVSADAQGSGVAKWFGAGANSVAARQRSDWRTDQAIDSPGAAGNASVPCEGELPLARLAAAAANGGNPDPMPCEGAFPAVRLASSAVRLVPRAG